jgi:bifunctional non-homologous end joining protein LigD
MRIPAPSARRDVDYIVGGSRKTLLTLVNLGCIAMHVMNSRTDQLDRPDWLAFDLDPSDGFESAARAGLLLRTRLEDHGLEAFAKTSGGRGLHVFVPLRRGATQNEVRAYAAKIAEELAAEHPKLVTLEARKAKRRAPVYLDVMRNASGQTIAAVFRLMAPHARCRCRLG